MNLPAMGAILYFAPVEKKWLRPHFMRLRRIWNNKEPQE
jgi:hypothetical protein